MIGVLILLLFLGLVGILLWFLDGIIWSDRSIGPPD